MGLNVVLVDMPLPGLDEEGARAGEGSAQSGSLFNVILTGAVPFLTLCSYWLFRRAGLNAAEHLIFNSYVLAHQNLIFFVTAPLVLLPPIDGTSYSIGTASGSPSTTFGRAPASFG